VFHGIRASVTHAFGSADLGGRTVLVQGVGSVGRSLARQLGQAGARLLVTDVDRARAIDVAEALGAKIVAPEDATRTSCDVFSPNATGGTLSSETIPELRCRIVAGAANNQLARPEDAELFGPLGILYAPDYVINAGGIIHLASLELLGEDEAQRDERLLGIGEALTEVFEAAAAESLSTGAAAERIVDRRLATAA
jgi:leucine dehydrogenase